MAQMMMDCILIGEVETKDIMTKSSLPVGGYSVSSTGRRSRILGNTPDSAW